MVLRAIIRAKCKYRTWNVNNKFNYKNSLTIMDMDKQYNKDLNSYIDELIQVLIGSTKSPSINSVGTMCLTKLKRK